MDSFVLSKSLNISWIWNMKKCTINFVYANTQVVKSGMIYLHKSINCQVFADQHVSQLPKHVVL